MIRVRYLVMEKRSSSSASRSRANAGAPAAQKLGAPASAAPATSPASKLEGVPAAAKISDDAVTLVTAERREGEQGKGPDRRESVIDRRAGLERRSKSR